VPAVHELAGGLWTWAARHPAWKEGDNWGPEVRSYALQTNDSVILFDPVAPPQELLQERTVEVVLTAEWHRRDAPALGFPIRGDDLPTAVNAQPAWFPGDRNLWIPEHNALIVGDSLYEGRAIPDEWLEGTSRDDYNAKLRPLLDLPVELLLPTHGDPVLDDAHAALTRALS
jgi:hypothetical protein